MSPARCLSFIVRQDKKGIFTFADFIIDQGRWFGNYVLPVVGVVALFAQLKRTSRPAWLNGSMIATAIGLLAFSGVYAWERWISGASPSFLPPSLIFIALSSYPIQAPLNLLLGEDNVVEEHLLIPTAILSWALVGAAIGGVLARIRRKAAEPGATDNPDDA